MAKQKSDILSGAGTGFEILKAIIDEVRKRGGDDDKIRQILNDKTLLANIVDQIMVTSSDVHKAQVNYAQTFEQMIANAKFDWVNPDITPENFPIEGEGSADLNLVLIQYNRIITREEVLHDMKRRSYRPAKLEEFLTFCALNLGLRPEFRSVIALGTSYKWALDNEHFVYAYFNGSELNLDLDSTNIYGDKTSFLAVRKQSH